MRILSSFLVGQFLAWHALASCSSKLTRPLSYTVNGNSIPVHENTTLKLSSNGTTPSILILDYGRNVEGLASFEVAHRTGDTSVFEMSYGESRAVLDSYMSDGPLDFSAAMDTYRINRYNLSSGSESVHTNRLIQGGLRYQKLNLSTAGELELSSIGFRPTVDDTPLSKLPGAFRCSDPVLTRIWEVGARTMQLNEFPANSLPDFWVITEEGAFVESLSPQPFSADYASAMTAFELDFVAKPIRNGFGFTVLSDTLGKGIYLFVNIANSSISAHAGSSELSDSLVVAPLPPSVSLGHWHRVHSSVDSSQISISIDGSTVLNFTQTTSFFGSFGLGASLHHAAMFTNVSLTAFGTEMYSSRLNSKSDLQAFLIGTNPLPVEVDGSRRDRIAYAGDLDMTTGSALASTYGREYINGTISLLGSFQLLPGFFVPTAKVQQPPRSADLSANITGLIGYSFSMVSAMAQYYEQTGETDFVSRWGPKAARMLDWAHSQVLPNGILNISNQAFAGDWNYYDPPVGGEVAKFNLIYASTLKKWIPLMDDAGLNSTLYMRRLDALRAAINRHLWSNSLQAYYHSDTHRDFFSQEANALAILSDTIPVNGTGNFTARALLSTMARELDVPAGPLAFSPASKASGWAQMISPYSSGYHLQAAFHARDGPAAKHLLQTLWGPMSDPKHTNYTGCFWEVLGEDGTPGLGSGTSLCHAWSAAPTAALSRYVLGVAPAKAGYSEWTITPQTLDLRWAEGRYPVPQGAFEVKWRYDSSDFLHMTVTPPAGTKGTVYLPAPMRRKVRKYEVTGGVANRDGGFTVGDTEFVFQQTA
ncbi:Six-hairpin glycosidase [Aspergillus steynii IBT 23096]|uniref:Six-hairpin glycosidase n=1 Tax=Aspergillus steynii IBT 23096 TaxID=1392250 RepID=A0A2I2GSG2_9EURO|nr:Six-hairpin glycosidase [Aspergillus steynii IBT 23096]PLB55815.1 Six-hairpin glycosidase [Aspergillus steynii IBT 23096]